MGRKADGRVVFGSMDCVRQRGVDGLFAARWDLGDVLFGPQLICLFRRRHHGAARCYSYDSNIVGTIVVPRRWPANDDDGIKFVGTEEPVSSSGVNSSNRCSIT